MLLNDSHGKPHRVIQSVILDCTLNGVCSFYHCIYIENHRLVLSVSMSNYADSYVHVLIR